MRSAPYLFPGIMPMVEKARLEGQIRELTDLIGIARAVVGSLELDEVLDKVLASAREMAGMPAGSLAVFDERKQSMILHVHAGLSPEFTSHDRWPLAGRGDSITETAMATGTIAVVPDLKRDTANNDPLLTRERIASMVCIPLTQQELPVGVLYLYDFVPRYFDPRQLNLLALLSSFAVMAINNARLHSRTRQMAITDALTSLHNNRYFKQVFPQEMARARRYAKPLALIMIDIDNFKRINDTYGHPRGDQVLQSLGKVLATSLRASDYSFRYGGEEFAVILPETRLEGAFLVAEGLREKVREMVSALKAGGVPQAVTISLGVASYPADCGSPELLLRHADHCLYRAKQEGKDRVYWESTQEARTGSQE